jgi:tetratricopeptide (TPR) repeat protein
MMRSITMNIMLAFVMQATAKEMTTSPTGNAQNSMHNVADKLVDKLVDRTRKMPSMYQAEALDESLDGTTLGKPGHLSTSRMSGASGVGPAAARDAFRFAPVARPNLLHRARVMAMPTAEDTRVGSAETVDSRTISASIPKELKRESRGTKVLSSAVEAPEQNSEMNAYAQERSGGNYGAGTWAEQERRYNAAKKDDRTRLDLFSSGISNFKAGEYEQALSDFQKAKDLEPQNYFADNFARFSDVYQVASFNIACCYSKLNQPEAGLRELEDSLHAGFENFKMIRTDPNLEEVRKEPGFKQLMDEYDESIFNEMFFNEETRDRFTKLFR